MPLNVLTLALTFGLAATVAQADSFQPVRDRAGFERAVVGKKLTALGVSLVVAPNGQISGRAFGKAVTGTWAWKGGYFCRDLNHGTKKLAYNCQAVGLTGQKIRFVSDKGRGQQAVLKIR